jgi:hypothetical protein
MTRGRGLSAFCGATAPIFMEQAMTRMTRRVSLLAGLAVLLFGSESAARREADVAERPVYNAPPTPEANPWADKGIASDYKFGAYYTRKVVNEKWHHDSRTDEWADVMVKFGHGPEELVFCRGDSYLPYWNTGDEKTRFQEMIERSGDGTAERPDTVNRYAHARIIESDASRAVIHWRYMPRFTTDVGPNRMPDQTRMVDEYFIAYPDRTVIRAVLEGQPRYEDWRRSVPGRLFRYELTDAGITETPSRKNDAALMTEAMGFTEKPKRGTQPAPLVALPQVLPAPVVRFTFDEGSGHTTTEVASGGQVTIDGHAAHWRRGVSGSALMFDGWTSAVRQQNDLSERIGDAVTLDAWIACAAYPWNTCPIVQQVQEEVDREVKGVMLPKQTKGFMLAMEPDGALALWATIDGQPYTLKADAVRIPRFRWTRVTGVVDAQGAEGTITLYVDGKQVAQATCPGGKIDTAPSHTLCIGQGMKRLPALPVGSGQYPAQYSFDGLIDEVAVYNAALTKDQVRSSTSVYEMSDERRTRPDMTRRVLPAGKKSWNRFAARYTHLPYHECWNKMFRVSGHPDVVVSFDMNPTRYVLWHGVGYIPMMVTENGRWYSNEFNECWWDGGCEPMSDKKMVFGRVHILEQSPARVVLKWRYPLSTVGYEIAYEDPNTRWGNWCDWYITIYPDGTAVKRMRVYQARQRGHEWHESMAIMGPEQRPEMVIDTTPALTLATTAGDVRKYSWIKEPPTGVDYKDVVLHVVNMKAEYDPYTVVRDLHRGNVYTKRGGTGYSVFPAWNHWPVAQLPSDGRHAVFPDRAAHSSLTHVYWPPSVAWGEQGLYEEKLMLEGLSNQSPEELLPLAKSWVSPAAVKPGEGVTAEYDPAQRAYVLTRDSGDTDVLQVTLAGSVESPLVNPALVVENWGGGGPATIQCSRPLADIRQGVVRRANGVDALVVWLEHNSRQPLELTISRLLTVDATIKALTTKNVPFRLGQAGTPPGRLRPVDR